MEKGFKLEFPGKRTGELFVNSCGCSKSDFLHSYGPAIKPHFMIFYILKGRGVFAMGRKEFSIETGSGFVIMPGELSYYRADRENPWTYAWVGFDGSLAAKLIQKIGLSAQTPVFKSEQAEVISEIIKDMEKHNTFGLSDQLRRNGQLKVFLSIIAENIAANAFNEADRANYYVRKAVEYMESNYCYPIKITEVAEHVCINRSYLYTLFMNCMGMSPQQFLATFRLTKATEMLQDTELTIETIALSCGYLDALVFTKAFKQMKGRSPSFYRKELRSGEAEEDFGHQRQTKELIKQLNKIYR